MPMGTNVWCVWYERLWGLKWHATRYDYENWKRPILTFFSSSALFSCSGLIWYDKSNWENMSDILASNNNDDDKNKTTTLNSQRWFVNIYYIHTDQFMQTWLARGSTDCSEIKYIWAKIYYIFASEVRTNRSNKRRNCSILIFRWPWVVSLLSSRFLCARARFASSDRFAIAPKTSNDRMNNRRIETGSAVAQWKMLIFFLSVRCLFSSYFFLLFSPFFQRLTRRQRDST